MKRVFSAIRRAPKRIGAVTALALAIAVPAVILAWGPERPTYTYESPAPHVTFNSMVNAPNYGDERNFVRIKEATAANNTYTDNINLQPGKEYTVMVYFHNNASPGLNESGQGIAQNTQMRVQMPATVKAGERARITGFVSADNAQPGTVWDEAYGAASNNIALRYVPNSATIYSNGAVDGQKMPESLFTTGAKLGYDKLDGKVPGCNQYAGWVTYNIKVDQPNFELVKKVSEKGKNNWQDSIAAKPGEEVDYRIHYKNTGTTVQNNVVIKDTLPKDVSYVNGTTHVSNAASSFQWQPTTNNEITKGGLNIGNYAAGGGAYVRFTAKVADAKKLECGKNTLVNKATAKTNNGDKSDTAEIIVKKECEEKPPVVKDIKVCELKTNKIITIKEDQFDSEKHSENLDDCKEAPEPQPEKIKVCDTKNSTIVTIDRPTYENNQDRYTTDLSQCEETPVTPEVPEELPRTGATDNILAALGLGATVTATVAYIASRKNSLVG